MEIKTCSDCKYVYLWKDYRWGMFSDYFNYKCSKYNFELTEEEYHSCCCNDWESTDEVENKKKQINFRKVKEIE